MAEYRRAEITTGLFIVLSVVVFGLFAFKIGGLSLDRFFGDSGPEFHAYFDEVRTLDTLGKVAVGGRRVGTVTALAPEAVRLTAEDVARLRDGGLDLAKSGVAVGRLRTRIKVTFVITEPTLRMGENASVKIEQEGFIGPFFLALNTGAWDEGRPPPTVSEAPPRTTPLASEAGAGLLDDFRTKFAPTLREIDGILSKINGDLLNDAARGDLQQMIPRLSNGLGEAQGLLADLRKLVDPANPDGLQESILRPANRLVGNLDGATTQARDLMTKAQPEIDRLMRTANEALESGKRTVAALERTATDAEPRLKAMLADVQALTGALEKKKDDFAGLIEGAKTLLGAATGAAEGASGLIGDNRANLAEMLRTFRNMSWELELLARKLRANPAVLFWGDDEPRLEAEPRDETGLRRSGRAKPYGQRDEGEKDGNAAPAKAVEGGGK